MRLRTIRKANKALDDETRELISYKLSLVMRTLKGCLIKQGNKRLASKIFDDTMFIIRNKVDGHPLEALEFVLSKLAPKMALLRKRRGGTMVLIPRLLPYERGISIAVHSLLKEANKRVERSVAERIGAAIYDILTDKPTPAIREIASLHKSIISNRFNIL